MKAKRFWLGCAVTLSVCLCMLHICPLQKGNADSVWDDEISFDSVEQIESSFDCHFVSTQNARRSDVFDFTWELREGAVWRKNNVDIFGDTVNIAILTYVKEVYSDFELSVDFLTGGKTSYWPVVAIRQQIPGKYYTTPGGGSGVFMQQDGKITFWGEIVGGIIEKDIPNPRSYYAAIWHNLRIVAVGSTVEVFLDGVSVQKVSVNSTDYQKGYVSLQSVNNDCAFDNFKIKDLSVGNVAANEPNRYTDKDIGTPLDELVKG